MLSSANKKSIVSPRKKKHKHNKQMDGFNVIKMKPRRLTNNICAGYMFVLTLLEVLGKTHMSVHDNNHDFIQANNNDEEIMGIKEELKEFLQKTVVSSEIEITQMEEEDIIEQEPFPTSTYLKFVPPQLNFKERHLGVPHLKKVTLVNTDDNKTIKMSSISGDTIHFHSSFFEHKKIPPKGNTTFTVVFLGRAEGQVSSSLYIHTSEGTFTYQVSGESIGSPYRLRPFGEVRLPLHAAFRPLIHLHNPHHYPIQVVEVYSSGSDFVLELPGGEIEGSRVLWELPPYTTKPVIRAKFHAMEQNNHTAYIRLKLNHSEEVLVVPVEVEVTSQPGLYTQEYFIDFGLGGSQDKPKKVILYLWNSLKKTLRIHSISTVPASPALKINSEVDKIPPGPTPVAVAELIFDWKVAFETKQTSGKIIIKCKQSQYEVAIPFVSTVLEGGLKINESATRFLTIDNKCSPRNLTITNQFKIPVAINNVSLLEEASNYFQIREFKPMIIAPNQSTVLLTIVPKEDVIKNLNLESSLVLFTNVSDVTISLLIFNGKLTKIFPRGFEDLELLDVGLVGTGTTKSLKFGLQNNNPVEIDLRGLVSNSRFITPKILGIFKGKEWEFLSQHSFANLTNSTKIKPDEIAVIELKIQALQNEEIISAQILVLSQYERFTIPVRVSVTFGSLKIIPKEIILYDCFPGKTCIQPLKVQSFFNRPMTATSITSVPPDCGMSFTPAPGGSEILPFSSSYIGDLKWEPGRNCENHYLGVTMNSSGTGVQWLQSELLSAYISDMDANLFRDKYHRLLNLTNGHSSGHWRDIVLRLDTNEVREELFKAKVNLIWPKFSNNSKLMFPLTQVTNTTIQRLKLYNPASHNVVVQLVMEWAYPQAKRLLDSFPPSFRLNVGGHCFDSSPKEFYISENFSELSEAHGKLNTTIAPREIYEVAIAYTPRNPQNSCSLLIIRNNLTVIEVIELHGEAAHAQLKFGNRKPGSDNPLMFEISDKHLKDCRSDKYKKYIMPNLTVKRTFTIRNVGKLAIYIKSFYINGLECEGYGFSVLNCAPFELPVNSSNKIFVAFTPDFTLTKVQRTLIIDTNIGTEVNYTLITTLPPYFISACNAVLRRPSWEIVLYYFAICSMLLFLFRTLDAACLESGRIIKCSFIILPKDKSSVPLDLQQIGTNVLKEFNPSSFKKVEVSSEHMEKSKEKENNNSRGGWLSNSSDDRHFNLQKEEPHNKNEGLTDYNKDKERDNSSSNSPTLVQLNNLNKSKKKLGKKNSMNLETAEPVHGVFPTKRKCKNFQKSSWCSVFSRNNAASMDKIKMKLSTAENGHIKQIRNNIEIKKEDMKKEEKKQNKIKKVPYKGTSKEEEETSSTLTDSSNDAEKENSDALSKLKNDKVKKINKERKGNVIEFKDSNYEGDCDDDELEKEKKHAVGKNMWKVHLKSNKLLSNVEANIWKPVVNDGQKNLDFAKHKVGKNNQEKKDKTGNKKNFSDKVGNQKVAENRALHQGSPCWEFRTFSEVVAKNDSQMCSNNISSKNQPKPQLQTSTIFSDTLKPTDPSVSLLGPIGSKKPISTWSPISYNVPGSQDNFFGKSFVERPPPYIGSNPEPDGSSVLDDTLQIDPENLWEDQHDAMELMHQQDTNYQLSWKDIVKNFSKEDLPTDKGRVSGNWDDYLWCSNRNVPTPSDNLGGRENFADHSWSSLLRSSWESPWNSSTSSTSRHTIDQNMGGNSVEERSPLSEADALIHDLQNPNLGLAQGSAILSPTLLSQNQTTGPSPGNQIRESLVWGDLFDPFHSLSSIWSPKTKNPWSASGN